MKENFKPIVILFTTLFLVMIGFGIVIPIFPFLIIELGGGPTALGFFMASFSIMQFIFAPLWGRLSDRVGRRPVLLIGLGGYGLTFILFGFVSELWMMFAIRILSGIISSATIPTAMAYIADTTSGEERSKGMGILGAAMGLGMIVGPALGGWLGHNSFSVPFFVAGGLAVLNLPFAIFFLPESLKEPVENTSHEKTRITLAVIKNPLFILFFIGFITNFTMSMFQGTFALFAADGAGFGPKEMGILFAVLGFVGVIIQGGLVGRLVKKFGDVKLIRAGMLISAIGMLLIVTSTNVFLLFLTSTIFSIGNTLLTPSSSSLVSKNAPGGKGAVLGIMQSFGSLGRIFGPMVGGILYDIHMNVPYSLGAVLLLLVLLLAGNKIARFDIDTDGAAARG
ncbi:MFS transporter [Desulfallas thermosapovorans]|uniref:Multidrug resistance protein n=1 Tax=Desulfallas thermosapovorans DSM 6562 TaxID=1121431 RepID=A0A5S4ZVS7_9FIRM|nr:MFS transporter [Desulfallas thermosapovorans]TYO96906.1 multidrug resistance protein [Desulfallas thermosapovorans DSM 6562]